MRGHGVCAPADSANWFPEGSLFGAAILLSAAIDLSLSAYGLPLSLPAPTPPVADQAENVDCFPVTPTPFLSRNDHFCLESCRS